MKKCCNCGKMFEPKEARKVFSEEMPEDLSYDTLYPDADLCGECAVKDTDECIEYGNSALRFKRPHPHISPEMEEEKAQEAKPAQKGSWKKRFKNALLIAGGIMTGAVVGVSIWRRLSSKDAVEADVSARVKVPEFIPIEKPDVTIIEDVIPVMKPDVTIIEDVIPRTYTKPSDSFVVSSHVRNLPLNRFASPEKVAEAEDLGIVLLPHQTLVSEYEKYTG